MRRFGSMAVGLFVALAPLAAAAGDGPPDAWLITKAKIAILTSVGTRGTAVQVSTMNQTMTLFGTVASLEDKSKAEKLARAIEGVMEVRNFLQVIASPAAEDADAASDSTLQSAVGVALMTMGLKKDGPLSRSSISVRSVDEGAVLLAGTADSLTAHLRAIETAKGVRGVRAVRSEIQSPDAKAVFRPRYLGQ